MQIRLSGAMCGHAWMPQIMCGYPGNWSITDKRRRFTSRASIAETVESILRESGGDFQDAGFTEDTLLILEYRKPNPRGYTYHCRTYELAELPSLADYVHKDTFVCDFGDFE